MYIAHTCTYCHACICTLKAVCMHVKLRIPVAFIVLYFLSCYILNILRRILIFLDVCMCVDMCNPLTHTHSLPQVDIHLQYIYNVDIHLQYICMYHTFDNYTVSWQNDV